VTSARFKAAPVATVADLLSRWGTQADYVSPSGIDPADNMPSTDAVEATASEATTVFNAWIVRMIGAVIDDELNTLGFYRPLNLRRMLDYLLTSSPDTLATYDPTTRDSALFDDMTTPAVESRDERIVTSLLDALDYVHSKLGDNPDAWRWGKLHTVTFASVVPFWKSLSIPNQDDTTFPNGFPRGGDGFTLDVASYDARPDTYADLSFIYTNGPAQRFTIDLDPAGPVAQNVIPGGAVWDNTSPHFRDDADLWRKNETHPMPFSAKDVDASEESSTTYLPASGR
jgi:penicillin amidase